MSNGYESSCQLARDLDGGIKPEAVVWAFKDCLTRRGAKVTNMILGHFKVKSPADIKKSNRRAAIETAYRAIYNPKSALFTRT